MYSDYPLVSIVITSYNRAGMIGTAIESALAQDYPNFEVIITDNCSQDNTTEVVSKYLADKRVKFFQNEENIGMIPNFKKGIEDLSEGEYFVNLCSDDVLAKKDFISQAIGLVKQYPDVTIVRGRNQSVNQDSGKVTPDDGKMFQEEFVKGEDFFLQCDGNENFGWEGVMLHRGTLNSLDVFSNSYSGFDKSSNLALLLYGNICLINEICYSFIVHSNSFSFNPSAQTSIDNFRMVEFPYEQAKKKGLIDRQKLELWRKKFILNLSTKAARALFIRDKKEFRQFVDKVQDDYGINEKELRKGVKTRFDYALFRYPIIGKTLTRFLKMFTKVTNTIMGKR